MIVVNTTEFGPVGLKFVYELVAEKKSFKQLTHAVIVLHPYEPADSEFAQETIWGTAHLHPNDVFSKETGRVTALEHAIKVFGSPKSDSRLRREILAGYYSRDLGEGWVPKAKSYTQFLKDQGKTFEKKSLPVVNLDEGIDGFGN
jgi:hypothetical protein